MKKLLIIACFLAMQAHAQIDSCAYYKAKCDTLNHKNFILSAQVDWVQYYLALITKYPKNVTYTKGWLTRAVANKLPANPYKTVKKKKR